MDEEVVFEPDGANNLNDWIEIGKDLDISHSSLNLKVKEGDLITPFQSLICRYYYALLPFTKEVDLTDDDLIEYKCNPKGLSQKLYDTPELWSGLLYINDMVSVADFKKRHIKVFTSDIVSKLEELMMLSEDDLNANKKEIE